MKKSEEVKEKIIKTTISLITESDGYVENINTRTIAEKAQVGVGLINYHFQTKDNLIEICVERMIGKVIAAFAPTNPERTPLGMLKYSAKLVFTFLIENQALSRISILSDYKNPDKADNTIKSAMGFNRILENIEISENERFVLAFAFTSVIQSLLLRKDQSDELFGYDINIKEERDKVIDLLVDNIFGGFGNENRHFSR